MGYYLLVQRDATDAPRAKPFVPPATPRPAWHLTRIYLLCIIVFRTFVLFSILSYLFTKWKWKQGDILAIFRSVHLKKLVL